MKMEVKKALLVFQKNAASGKVKTRLAASVGREKALEIYLELVNRTYLEVAKLDGIEVIPFFSDYVEALPITLENSPSSQVQAGNNLGQRMSNAFGWAFSQGYDWVGIIGTDCPDIDHHIIEDGFRRLQDLDFSIGPAHDGGYYFLAMREFHPWIFENITWSSQKVLAETLALANSRKLTFSLMEELRDVDIEADYLAFLAKKTT